MKNAAATTARSRRTTRHGRHAGEHVVAAQVANQSTVLAIDAAAPARFDSAYMLVYFVGGSLGTAFGAAAVEWLGWQATAAAAAVGGAAVITGEFPVSRVPRWAGWRRER